MKAFPSITLDVTVVKDTYVYILHNHMTIGIFGSIDWRHSSPSLFGSDSCWVTCYGYLWPAILEQGGYSMAKVLQSYSTLNINVILSPLPFMQLLLFQK